jgi:hypothetical protein
MFAAKICEPVRSGPPPGRPRLLLEDSNPNRTVAAHGISSPPPAGFTSEGCPSAWLFASAITERPARVRVLGRSQMMPLNASAFVILTATA